MLPHSRRVSRTLFEKTFKKSILFHSEHFSLRVGLLPPNTRSMASRFSFVVSKKIDSRATKRNVLRRRGYEAVAKIIDEAKPQHVFLFFPKKTSTDLSFEAFSKEIKQLITMVQ